ncbi:MAG: hypothetical protein A2798_03160 [Candidatus Levybacteria bacterium RIFCSPHIGHO2_01_FULL_37_17]|nr:MAG: hypothetical protein A2798_03160 [Candidatus Levybacteria bacterium RIFCSPHIGHO2_01_FULL_37_17]OGH36854.1 MAG: hypothetical protein A2959_01150 [Candidatus Levybacteria bacterium RIFCSPLOWO2_01_FULL_38_23]
MVEKEQRINIALSGGPCTGKSTLAAYLTYRLKMEGFDYDSIGEESRRLKTEFGQFESPVERCYMWMQQDREERRSNAQDGFITDTPLFHLFIGARLYQATRKDLMVVRELQRQSISATERYEIIAIAQDPREFPYKTDNSRSSEEETSTKLHGMMRNFIELYFPEKLLLVSGTPEERGDQVVTQLKILRAIRANELLNTEQNLS